MVQKTSGAHIEALLSAKTFSCCGNKRSRRVSLLIFSQENVIKFTFSFHTISHMTRRRRRKKKNFEFFFEKKKKIAVTDSLKGLVCVSFILLYDDYLFLWLFFFVFTFFFPPFSSEVVLDTGDLDVLMVTTFILLFLWLFVQMGTRDPRSAIEHFDGYGPYRRVSSTPLN